MAARKANENKESIFANFSHLGRFFKYCSALTWDLAEEVEFEVRVLRIPAESARFQARVLCIPFEVSCGEVRSTHDRRLPPPPPPSSLQSPTKRTTWKRQHCTISEDSNPRRLVTEHERNHRAMASLYIKMANTVKFLEWVHSILANYSDRLLNWRYRVV